MERDAFMQAVPAALAPVFAGRRAVLATCRESCDYETRLLKVLEHTDVAGRVDRELVRFLFGLIRREVEENLPAYVCRRCFKRSNPQCHCHGKKWLTQRESEVPGVVKRLSSSVAVLPKRPS